MTQREFRIKEGDTSPPLFATLINTDTGKPVNLVGASARFHMSDEDGGLVLDEPAHILGDGLTGGVRFDAWTVTHTAVAGRYRGEIEITYPNSSVGSFPKEANGFPILIVSDLA